MNSLTPEEPLTPSGYRAIASALRGRIQSGASPSGRLPSEGALMAEYGVARETVRHALSVLVEEGLIRSSHGRGYFVAGASTEELPRYEVVADSLRSRISSGAIAPGSVLPSEALLQTEFEISRTTARRALAELEKEGVIVRRDGRRFVR